MAPPAGYEVVHTRLRDLARRGRRYADAPQRRSSAVVWPARRRPIRRRPARLL